MHMGDNLPMILSRIKEHRKRRGLTQIELAKIADVGRATIAAIETGKRKRVHPARHRREAGAGVEGEPPGPRLGYAHAAATELLGDD